MESTQMVAYNPQTRMFLRNDNGVWKTTPDKMMASGYPNRSMQRFVETAKRIFPGDWMIMRRQDAIKLMDVPADVRSAVEAAQKPETQVPSPKKMSHPEYTGGRTSGSENILSLMRSLEAAYSEERWAEVYNAVGEYNKKVSQIYHYIEYKNLNAAKGYKAYRALKRVLVERRKLKNELFVINKLRAGEQITAEDVERMSSVVWTPEIEDLMEEN